MRAQAWLVAWLVAGLSASAAGDTTRGLPAPARHAFWGISTGSEDQTLPANKWKAANFVLAAPVAMQKQPSWNHPHPVPSNLSKQASPTAACPLPQWCRSGVGIALQSTD